ncbi:hypothetical protein B0H16DRAFT_1016625 [Mycena metata]|uniref:Uncharacterized protein n=1 Tax=Mycena metata TaxID=1033252 RepID=A0AAD7IHD5_9AGAR|nr:hypothetical protein B0H16DRAFT_1016625 [Mycena metata]
MIHCLYHRCRLPHPHDRTKRPHDHHAYYICIRRTLASSHTIRSRASKTPTLSLLSISLHYTLDVSHMYVILSVQYNCNVRSMMYSGIYLSSTPSCISEFALSSRAYLNLPSLSRISEFEARRFRCCGRSLPVRGVFDSKVDNSTTTTSHLLCSPAYATSVRARKFRTQVKANCFGLLMTPPATASSTQVPTKSTKLLFKKAPGPKHRPQRTPPTNKFSIQITVADGRIRFEFWGVGRTYVLSYVLASDR